MPDTLLLVYSYPHLSTTQLNSFNPLPAQNIQGLDKPLWWRLSSFIKKTFTTLRFEGCTDIQIKVFLLLRNTIFKLSLIENVPSCFLIEMKDLLFCQAQGQTWNVKSKLGPEVRSVMGWPTHHHPPYNFFWAENCLLRLGKGQGKVRWWSGGQVNVRWTSGNARWTSGEV